MHRATPRTKVRAAIAVHVLMLPWWIIVWGAFSWWLAWAIAASGFGSPLEWNSLTVLLAVMIGSVGLGMWLRLLVVSLVRSRDEGYDRVWPFPVLWAVVMTVTTVYALFLTSQLFVWLFPVPARFR